MKKRAHTLLVLASVVLMACAAPSVPVWKKAVAGDGPGDMSKVEHAPLEVRNLQKSRSGNRDEYEVFGLRYAVLDTALGFKERGIASWYGSKFHGNATASGEIYDMHALTAAHKHLPLPTFVRVTRIDTGQSLIVKVNDRGPFVGDRIIDLSFAAAARLNMLDSGKAEVLVEALSTHVVPDSLSRYVQVGAFNDALKADNLMQQISSIVGLPVKLDFEAARRVYRVRVGPLDNDGAVNNTLKLLTSAGFDGYPVKKAIH